MISFWTSTSKVSFCCRRRSAGINSPAANFCVLLSQREQLASLYSVKADSLTRTAGMGYRLPTEAEWEFACRAGTETKYWNGDSLDALSAVGWFETNSGKTRTRTVAESQPNAWGLFDVHGNVWEWVDDWWETGHYNKLTGQAAIDPPGPTEGKRRIIRGGGFSVPAALCRAAFRSFHNPVDGNRTMGFRVALSIEAGRTAAQTAADAQRKLAQWLMGNKHTFIADKFESGSLNGAPLPAGPWRIHSVDLFNLTDDGARQFADLAVASDSVVGLYALKTEPDFTVAGLKQLVRVKSIVRFGGSFGKTAGDDFAALAELPNLAEVNVSDSPGANDAFLATVKKLTQVTSLWANACPVSDRGVAELVEMPQLKSLWINSSQLTDKSWDSLSRLKKLERLTFGGSQEIRGKGISQLRDAPLNRLHLFQAQLSDDALKEIAAIPALRMLTLNQTTISDAGLKHLAGTSLTDLNLKETKATEQGVMQLSVALPACRIEWDGPLIEPTALNDRQAAEQLRPHVGLITLRLESGARINLHRNSTEPLPSQPFQLVEMSFYGIQPPPDFTSKTLLPAIGGLKFLEGIGSFYEGSFTTAELTRLAKLPCAATLTDFCVGNCNLTAEHLDLLKTFPKLRRIGLRASRPSAELFARLKAEHPAMVSLALLDLATETPLDDAALDALAALPLEELTLMHFGRLDRPLFERIATMSELKTLNVQVSSVTDDAAAPLAGCRKLEKLLLSFTSTTDELLPALDKLEHLVDLNVWDTKMTEPALREFAKRHPKCLVFARNLVIQPTK